jgi:hypothetical protein
MHDFIDIFAFYVNQISMHNIRNIKKRKSMTYDFQHTKLSKSGALVYDYVFSTPEEKKTHGWWWRRTYLGQYTPVLSLKPL